MHSYFRVIRPTFVLTGCLRNSKNKTLASQIKKLFVRDRYWCPQSWGLVSPILLLAVIGAWSKLDLIWRRLGQSTGKCYLVWVSNNEFYVVHESCWMTEKSSPSEGFTDRSRGRWGGHYSVGIFLVEIWAKNEKWEAGKTRKKENVNKLQPLTSA
jgi:hypothetical protein